MKSLMVLCPPLPNLRYTDIYTHSKPNQPNQAKPHTHLPQLPHARRQRPPLLEGQRPRLPLRQPPTGLLRLELRDGGGGQVAEEGAGVDFEGGEGPQDDGEVPRGDFVGGVGVGSGGWGVEEVACAGLEGGDEGSGRAVVEADWWVVVWLWGWGCWLSDRDAQREGRKVAYRGM